MISHDLIVTIVSRGFADDVMTAAKAVGARGGTVVNARGTGKHELQTFFGSIIQPEKELILILTERENRNNVMETICREAGLTKAGRGICFSLPVDGVTGMSAFVEKKPTVDDAPDKHKADTDSKKSGKAHNKGAKVTPVGDAATAANCSESVPVNDESASISDEPAIKSDKSV